MQFSALMIQTDTQPLISTGAAVIATETETVATQTSVVGPCPRRV